MGEAEFEQKPVVKAVEAAIVEQGNEAAELRVTIIGDRPRFPCNPGSISNGHLRVAVFSGRVPTSRH